MPSQFEAIDKVAFELGVIRAWQGEGPLALCDVGGGLNLFTPACAALGWRAILVDDFDDSVNHEYGDAAFAAHRRHGVEVVRRDVVEHGLDLPPASLDVVTLFDTMEHWHHSPKRVFHALMKLLKPGGLFFLGGPNCVNLRKRITVPLGRGKWSTMQAWYEADRFRGHVREPDVADLHYMARDMGLADVRIMGRNWAGRNSPNPVIRLATRAVDHVLRVRPSLCSDIYLLGRRPA